MRPGLLAERLVSALHLAHGRHAQARCTFVAGTPLGDPIEVGAAVAVYRDEPRQQPLVLTASKSWVGHGEPAAGLAGLLFAHAAATQALVLPVLHLRSVNTYVSNALDQLSASSGAGTAVLPKQRGIGPAASDSNRMWGTSAFAFQGTNAHAVVAAGTPANTAGSAQTPAWQRKRHYVLPAAHSLITDASVGRGVSATAGSGPAAQLVLFHCDLARTRLAFLWDHHVMGKAIFPGAGYFELSSAALRALVPDSSAHEHMAVAGAAIPAALLLPGGLPSVTLECSAAGSGGIEIASLTAGGRAVHVTAVATSSSLQPAGSGDTSSAAAGSHSHMLTSVSDAAPQKAAAIAALPIHTGRSGLWLDPAPFDCFLQLGQVFKAAGSRDVYVPAGFAALQLSAVEADVLSSTRGSTAWAATVPVVPMAPKGSVCSNFRLSCSEANQRQLCAISALAAKSMGRAHAGGAPAIGKDSRTAVGEQTECLFEVGWRVGDPSLAIVVEAAVESEGSKLHMLPVSNQGPPESLASSAVAAIQGLLQGTAFDRPATQLLTTGAALVPACAAGSGSKAALAALLCGIVKTLHQEAPQISWTAYDADNQRPTQHRGRPAALHAGTVVGHPTADAFGSAERASALVVPQLLKSTASERLGPFHLFPVPRGSLNTLATMPVDGSTASVEPGQVLVVVKAVGINFRDVLNVLGMYPGDPGPPGGDCAGVVVASGPGVSHLRPGDAVFGLAGGSLGSHVHVSSQTVTHVSAAPASQFCSGIGTGCGLRHVPCLNALQMPANLDFEAAATTPTVCITVDSAFRQSAVVRPGDRVLVHAAAGGVGIAAMQLIAALGGSTVATAGSSSKRALVRSLGPSQVHGSRDTVFVSELAEVGGASVALNSLTSSGMVAGSLAALDVGGRFVEISKRDIWSAARVAQGAGMQGE